MTAGVIEAAMDYKCKRIIDGKTYNTETATRLASWDIEPGDPNYEGVTQRQHLYQNRHGAFFVYWSDDDGPYGEERGLRPLTPDEARIWLEHHAGYEVDLIESLFGQMPEAGSSESKFTLRLPDSLRERLATLAKANGQSLNAWIVRCLEYCASYDGSSAEPKGR